MRRRTVHAEGIEQFVSRPGGLGETSRRLSSAGQLGWRTAE